MRGIRLTAEHRTVLRNRCFKAFGVDAPFWELALRLTLFRATDTRDVSQDISESPAKDVALVLWHPQRFLDGVGEAIACKSKVL